MILAIDAGNSRIKCGLHDGRSWLHRAWVATARAVELEAAWRDWPQPDGVLACNVAGAAAGAAIEAALAARRLVPYWIEAAAEQCGIRSSYEDPRQLGADRWAALVGAWHLHPGSALVVNAGTAVTVDALSDEGLFLGGIIIPGLQLMREALAQNTAALKLAAGEVSYFPNRTADAIQSGAVHAVCGAVERLAGFMLEAGQPPPLAIVSGGGAQLLQPHLNLEARVVDNLVLEGLIRIAQETGVR